MTINPHSNIQSDDSNPLTLGLTEDCSMVTKDNHEDKKPGNGTQGHFLMKNKDKNTKKTTTENKDT